MRQYSGRPSNISASLFIAALCWVLGTVGAATETDVSQSFPQGSTGYQANVPTTSQNILSAATLTVGGPAIQSQGGSNANPAILTDGSYGLVPANGGGGPGEVALFQGNTLTYTFNTAVGYNITQIDVFTGWGDSGRYQPNFTVSYSTVGAPNTFVQIASVNYTPGGGNGAWVSLTNLGLGSVNVGAIQFAFGPQQNGFVGYTELAVQGSLAGGSGNDIWVGGTAGAPSDWGTAGNWQSGTVPSGANAITFGTAGSFPTVDLGSADRSTIGLLFLGSVSTTIGSTASHTLILDNTAAAKSATVTATGTQSITSAVKLNSNLVIAESAGTLLTFGGAISEGSSSASLTANVSGATVSLGAANSYSGGTAINAGTLRVVTGALGTVGNITFNGGVLQYATGTAAPDDLAVRFKNSTGAPVNIDVNGNTVVYAGVIDATNTAGFTVSDSGANGVLTLSAANLYSGPTTVSSGTLRINNANAIPRTATANANAVVVASGGILDLNTISTSINSLSGAGVVDTVSGGGAPTLTIGANNDSSTFSGVIKNSSGSMALVKAGTGTLVLSGANTLSGGVTISAGTLRIVSPSTLPAADAVAVNANTVLTGTGSADGTTTVSANGHLAPGTNTTGNAGGIGTLTLGAAVLSSGSILDFDFGAPGSSDLLAVTGALNLPSTGSVSLNVFNTGAMTNGTYKIITFGSLVNTFNPNSLSLAFTPLAGGTYTFQQNGNEIDLIIAGTVGKASGVFSTAAYNSTSGNVELIPGVMTDTNIGLNTNKNYLTAVNLNGPALTINNIPFASAVGGNPVSVPSQNFSLANTQMTFVGRGNSATGQIGTLLQTFNYAGNPSVLTLSGLTPGQTYVTTYYNQSFSTHGNRIITVTGSDGGQISGWDEDLGVQGDGNLLRYTFIAVAQTENLTSTPLSGGTTQHMYGISNEQTFNNTWQGGNNWLAATWSNFLPNYVGANAIFPAQPAPTSIDASNVTTGHIQVDGSNPFNFTGSGLTLQTDNGGVAVLNTVSGSHVISAPVNVNITDAAKFGRGTLTFANAVSGSNGLVVENGTLILSATNSYTGITKVNGGTLQLADPGALGQTSSIIVNTNAVLDLNGQSPVLNGVAPVIADLSGTGGTVGALTNSSSTAVTYPGNIVSSTNAFTVGGTGDITLTGVINGASALTLTKVGSNTLTLSGNIDNTNLVLIINGGTVVLSKTSSPNAHAVSGAAGVVINSGVLKLAGTGGDQISDISSVTVNTNGTLDLNGTSESFDGLSGAGIVTNNAGSTTSTVTVGANSASGVFTGTIQNGAGNTGVVAFTKSGGGVLQISGTNTYTGTTTIAAGTLQLSVSTLSPLSIVPNFSFETPSLGTGGGAYIYNPLGASWTFAGQSGISANNSAFGSNNAPDGTQAAIIQNSGSFSQAINFPSSGVYRVTFGTEFRGGLGPNTFKVTIDGTVINGLGAVIPTASNSFNTRSGTFTVATNGSHTLAFVGIPPNGNDLTSFVDNVVISGAQTGIVNNAIPSGSPLVIGTSGILDLNSYQVTVASLADLTPGSGGQVINSNPGVPAALSVNLTGGTSSFSGIISDNGAANAVSLVKNGTGTLILSGVNTYSGTTTVQGGALTVDGTIAGSAVSLSSPAQLRGNNGTVNAPVTAVTGSYISPGDTTGTANAGATLTLQSLDVSGGGTVNIRLANPGAAPTFDLVKISSPVALDLSGGILNVQSNPGNYSGAAAITVLQTTGGNEIIRPFSTLTVASGITVQYRNTSNAVVVPDGSTAATFASQVVLVLSAAVTPVTVDAFSAQTDGAGVLISWNCVSEYQNAGFNVYRRAITGSAWSKINPALIAGRITNPDSKKYQMYDWVQPGVYEYRLESTSVMGVSEAFKTLAGPIAVDDAGTALSAVSTHGLEAAFSSIAADRNLLHTQNVSAQFAAGSFTNENSDNAASGRNSALSFAQDVGDLGEARSNGGTLAAPATATTLPLPGSVANAGTHDVAALAAARVPSSSVSMPVAAARWFSSGNVRTSTVFTGAKVTYHDSGIMLIPSAALPAGLDVNHLAVQREGASIPVLSAAPNGLIVYGQGYEDDYTNQDALFLRPTAAATSMGQPTHAQGLFASTQTANTQSPASATSSYHDVYFDYNSAYRPYTFAPWFSSQYLTADETNGTTQTFALSTPDASGSPASLTVNIWSLTLQNHAMQVLVNGHAAGQAVWNGGGRMVQLTFGVPSGALIAGDNSIELITPAIAGVSGQIAFLHSMTVSYTRQLNGSGPLTVYNTGTTSQLYELSNLPSANAWVADVRYASRAALLPYEAQAQGNGKYKIRFVGNSGGTGQFQVVPYGMENAPLSITRQQVKPAKLSGVYLATGPSQFGAGVQALLMQRAKEGLRGQYVDQEQLFNYYNYGRYGPAGIQNAVRALRPKYLLLLGRTTYDYKNYSGANVDPLCPAFLVSTTFWAQTTSDAMFGDMGRGYPEVAIGRIPATTAQELSVAVSHILNYSGAPSSGIRVHAVADQADPAVGDFPAQAVVLSQSFPDMSWDANYLGVTSATPGEVTNALKTAANGTADWVVYIGHGNAQHLGNETPNILDTTLVQEWTGDVVFLQSTCTANWMAKDVQDYKSIAIQALTQPQGGIAASVATSTYMNSDYAVPFMTQLMKNADGGAGMRWGTALLNTQQWAFREGSLSSFYIDLGRTEQLLGDPAMPVFMAPAGQNGSSKPAAAATGTF